MNTWYAFFTRYLRAAVEVGTFGGGAIGGGLGLLLVRLPTIGLLLVEPSDRWLAIAVLAAGGGILATFALTLLALAAATLSRISRLLAARLRPRRLAATGLVVAALASHAFFRLAFGVVHDLLSVQAGLVLLGLFAAALTALLAVAVDWHRSPRPFVPPAAARTSSSVALLLLFAALFAWGWPQLREAAQRDTPAMANPPAAAIGRRETAGRPPRVMLISIDTLRADHLSLYGYRRPTSPALETLAADGTVFEHVHSQAPWTLPSHASMFTGRYPWAVGVMFVDLMRIQTSHSADSLAAGDSTLAEQLVERGYRTSGIASMPWFVGPYGLQKGFERMLIVRGDDRARQVVDRALDWTVRAVEHPHFLFLHFSDVHDYRAPASFVARFHDGNYRGQFAGRATRATANLGQGVDAEDLRYLEALYDAAATYVDSELGRFFAELRRRGLYDDALILVTADHGEAFLEHGHTGHGFSLYEEQIRVPLVIKPPRSFPVATRRSEAWAGLVDLLPTVLDYVGGDRPTGVVGTSLRAAIEGRALPARRLYSGATMFLSSYAALENERIFIHRHVPPMELFSLRRWMPNLRAFYTFGPSESFDLALDPGERHDLASADPAMAVGMERAIIEELAAHRRSAHDLTFDDEEMRKIRALGYLH